ncbi:MAG: hypothetical protein ACFHX7_13615 [Pseudomonadota bacterium]
MQKLNQVMCVIALASLVIAARPAFAVPMYVLNGSEVTGIQGVEVGGNLYDVTFVDGKVSSFWFDNGVATTAPFANLAEAAAASTALRQVIETVPLFGGTLRNQTYRINGCASQPFEDSCRVHTLHAESNVNHGIEIEFSTLAMSRISIPAGPTFSLTFVYPSILRSFYDSADNSLYPASHDTPAIENVFAKWSLTGPTVLVPAPGALALLAVGLVALSLASRRG